MIQLRCMILFWMKKKLRLCHKKVLAWTSRNKEETSVEIGPDYGALEYHENLEKESSLGECIPKLLKDSAILNPHQIFQLSLHLPVRYRYLNWVLLYGTQSHGISLNTLYSQCKDQGPSILIVQDTNGHSFGAYVSDWWRIEPQYYGSGESFVFSLSPELKFYHWTRKNNFFMCSRRDFISVGGGNHFSLWLDSDFMNGSSNSSETFGNPTLSSMEDFQVSIVEVWGFIDK